MKEEIISKNKKNILIIIALSAGLVLPSFIQNIVYLGNNKQLIIGTIINASLFASGIYVKDNKKIIALSTLPSISNMLTGFLFSGLTFYSKMMLPVIWIGNLMLIYLSRLLSTKMKYIPACLLSILTKVSIIYLGFKIISSIFNFPNQIINAMNLSMGLIQFHTACLGLIVSIIFKKLYERYE